MPNKIGPNEWSKFLKDIADNLTLSNVRTIKFLYKDFIPVGKAEKLMDSFELLMALEEVDIISCNDITHLYEIIATIPRKDLIKKLDAYEATRLSKEKSFKDDEENRSKSVGSEKQLKTNLKKEGTRAKSTSSLENTNPKPFTLLSPAHFRKKPSNANNHLPNHLLGAVENREVHTQPSGTRPKEYPMKRKPRGKCLIFSNSFLKTVKLHSGATLGERRGTEHDVVNLKKTFEWLEFQVTVYPDHTASEILDVLRHVAEKENHKEYDCFVCCILSHGFDGGIYGNDGRKVPLKDVKETFEGDSCPKLFQKPKLFFIQACQGENDGKGIGLESDSPMAPQQNREQTPAAINTVRVYKEIPSNADFLVFMATSSGTTSWRNPRTGSWFVQCLCEVLQQHAMTWSLSEMLLEINNKIAQKEDKTPEGATAKQMSDAGRNTMRMQLYFYPSTLFSVTNQQQNNYQLQEDRHEKKQPIESPCDDPF